MEVCNGALIEPEHTHTHMRVVVAPQDFHVRRSHLVVDAAALYIAVHAACAAPVQVGDFHGRARGVHRLRRDTRLRPAHIPASDHHRRQYFVLDHWLFSFHNIYGSETWSDRSICMSLDKRHVSELTYDIEIHLTYDIETP